MKAPKWITLIVSGGVLLQLDSCTADTSYYFFEILVNTYLPEIVNGLLETGTV